MQTNLKKNISTHSRPTMKGYVFLYLKEEKLETEEDILYCLVELLKSLNCFMKEITYNVALSILINLFVYCLFAIDCCWF